MFLQLAVLDVGISELLFILALAVLLYAAHTIAELPQILMAVVRGVHNELNGYYEDKKKQTGNAEAQDR